MSLRDSTPACQSKPLQPHVLSSPHAHHLMLVVGPSLKDGPPTVTRTDPASNFKVLVNDPILKKQRIAIEPGQGKNSNKNPIAERAVQELETTPSGALRQSLFSSHSCHSHLGLELHLAYPHLKCGQSGTSFQTSNYPSSATAQLPSSMSSIYPITPTVSVPKPLAAKASYSFHGCW